MAPAKAFTTTNRFRELRRKASDLQYAVNFLIYTNDGTQRRGRCLGTLGATVMRRQVKGCEFLRHWLLWQALLTKTHCGSRQNLLVVPRGQVPKYRGLTFLYILQCGRCFGELGSINKAKEIERTTFPATVRCPIYAASV